MILHLPAILFASLLTLSTGEVGSATPAPSADTGPRRIELEPSRFTTLAGHLASGDALLRWEFADITLAAVLEAYARELESAARERPGTAARQAKLGRWQQATRELIRQLEDSRRRLAEGAAVELHLDQRRELLIIIEGQPLAITAPRAEAEVEIERQVVERFCAYNDCSMLEPTRASGPDTAAPSASAWLFRQGRAPLYETGDGIQFEFRDLSDRADRAAVCERAATELRELATALTQAALRGHRIDWDDLAQPVVSPGSSQRIVVNAQGRYISLALPLLARLSPGDWQRVVEWLRRGGPGKDKTLLLTRAQRLLSVQVPGD